MVPKLCHVSTGDWAVLYFVSNISDKKIHEGHDVDGNLCAAFAKSLGFDIEYYEFSDSDEVDGYTPETFGSIQGLWKL